MANYICIAEYILYILDMRQREPPSYQKSPQAQIHISPVTNPSYLRTVHAESIEDHLGVTQESVPLL